MIAKELLDYIERTLKDGFPAEDIKQALVDAGWRKEDVAAAFVTVQGAMHASPPSPAPPRVQVQETKPKETAAPVSGLQSTPPRSEVRPLAGGTYASLPSSSPLIPKLKDVAAPEIKPAAPQAGAPAARTALTGASFSDLARAKQRRRQMVVWLVSLGAVILLAGGWGVLAFTRGYWPFAALEEPEDTAQNTPPPPPEITDPILVFRASFDAQDYKVTLLGEFNFPGTAKSGTTTLTFAAEQFTVYQKGTPMFVGGAEKSIGMVAGRLVVLDHKAKTYSVIDDPAANPTAAAALRKTFTAASPLSNILAASSSILWGKAGQYDWIAQLATSSPFIVPFAPGATSTEVKIALEPGSNLIRTISARVRSLDAWQNLSVSYEPLASSSDFLAIPAGYKETRLR